MKLYLTDLQKIWGEPNSLKNISLKDRLGCICTDSRKLKRGDFFIPIIGNRYNGHDFIEQAFKKGIQATVVAREYSSAVPKELLHWVVNDTLIAYQEIALLHRSSLNIPLIAITVPEKT